MSPSLKKSAITITIPRRRRENSTPFTAERKGALMRRKKCSSTRTNWPRGQKYFRVGISSVSPDHKLLAYSTDTNGSETYVIRIKTLETGELWSDEIKNSSYSFAWANDSKTFFYDQLDDAHRPYKALKHVLGTSVDLDPTVYEEKDDRFFLEISKSRSEKFIFVSVESELTSEVRFVDADHPDGELTLIRARENDLLYSVDHHGDRFFIVTNENAKNFKVIETPVASVRTRSIGRTFSPTIRRSRLMPLTPSKIIW